MRKTFFIFSFLVAVSAHAIVVSDYTTAEQPPSGLDWSYVYYYKGSSAVAVDDYWILTAAHVADDSGTGTLLIDSTAYYQREIIFHDTADLALVRYDKAFPGFYDLYTGGLVPWNPFAPRYSILLVGFGTTGTVSSASWTDSGSGRGIKRWGSQEIESTEFLTYDVGGNSGERSSEGFWMDFNLNDTDYEAGAGIGDSGGGAFINDNGTWKLAGINTVRLGSNGEFTSMFAVSIPEYSSWISQTVPEPIAAVFCIAFGVLFLFIHRRFC